MNADRPSINVALSSQILFAVLLPLTSWSAAAWGALSLAALSLALALRGGLGGLEGGGVVGSGVGRTDGRSFPRLPLGAVLCFSSMAGLSVFFKGDELFPHTGLFFACGLGAASLADAFLPAILGRSFRRIRRLSLLLGASYTLAALLHAALFPRLAYLYFGVGGLMTVSIIDIASGIFLSARQARGAKPPRGPHLAAALVFASAFSLSARPAMAQATTQGAESRPPSRGSGSVEARTEEETFAALFGEETPSESPEEELRVAAVRVETPDCFTEAYVLSFARELEAGQRLSRGELETAMRRIEERMAFSGRFYGAGLSYRSVVEDADATAGGDDARGRGRDAGYGFAASGRGAADVVVTISVTDGFWWDFNFEPYDVWIGYRNLFRSGKELQAIAGLNTQALCYRDPAVGNGSMYYAAEAGHRVQEDANAEGADYLYESLALSGEAGLAFGDDVRLGLGAGYALYRAAGRYFLYPDYEAPDRAELELLGMGGELDRYEGVATLSLRSSLGAYSYQRRGGLKGRVEGDLSALAPRANAAEAALKATVSGDLRRDFTLWGGASGSGADRLIRLTLHERAEYIPRRLDGGAIAEPLWADIDEGRYLSLLISGELASLTRLTLGLDALGAVCLGFTRLSLIPELYYEFTVVRSHAYDEEPVWDHNVGFLLKGAFSAPVNRVFSLGLACGLPSEGAGADEREPRFALFLEIE